MSSVKTASFTLEVFLFVGNFSFTWLWFYHIVLKRSQMKVHPSSADLDGANDDDDDNDDNDDVYDDDYPDLGHWEGPVQPAPLGHPGGDDDEGDEGEGGGCLPDLHPVLARDAEDDEQPEVGEDGPEHGDHEDGVGLDAARLPLGDDVDTDGGDDQQVEGAGADDEAGTWS